MKVIICGAGQVGWQIARHLSGERNDVTVVDNNPELVRRAADTLDVQELNTGLRQEGLFNSVITFSAKATSGAGLLITGFAFLGVNMFLAGLHSYGQL